jgi:hypothetical protein
VLITREHTHGTIKFYHIEQPIIEPNGKVRRLRHMLVFTFSFSFFISYICLSLHDKKHSPSHDLPSTDALRNDYVPFYTSYLSCH